MSKLAIELIEKERKERTGRLELGCCGLTELPEVLFQLVWLEELILSNKWWDREQYEYVSSTNKGANNRLSFLPKGLAKLKKLKLLYCGGEEESWKIKDLSIIENLSALKVLYLNGTRSENYRFIENLSQIEILSLTYNEITDCSFLEKLTGLTHLYLKNNQISDCSFLEKLTGLTELSLSSKIIDISFLKKLTQLNYLNLYDNQISDYSFLEKLTGLTELSLSKNQISDISFLGNLTGLTKLWLNSNKISDYSFLEKLTGLTALSLSKNQISDISFLGNLTSLTNLELNSNQISDCSFLGNLTNLTSLFLRENQIKDCSFLKKLTRLSTLVLSSNQINDLSFLGNLTGLIQLELNSNQISDCSFLGNLTGLTKLYLRENQIKDCSFLKKLTRLSTLVLSSNQINDLSFLENLTGLTILELNNSQINDCSFLENLTGLTKLYLDKNQISDSSFLEKLPLLTILVLRNNQISNIDSLQNLKKLKTVKLNNNKIEILPQWVTQRDFKVKYEIGYIEGAITLYNNPITSPPLEIVKEGHDAVVRYFERMDRDTEKALLYEAKVLLVGRTGAGKTSLRCKLRHIEEDMPKEKESTSGIDVEAITYEMENGKEFRMNVWDFEGQAISHQTHQFFLTRRSLYVFVADSRTQKEDTDYWFQIVELLGGGSPMLIFHNEKKGAVALFNEEAILERFGDFLRKDAYRADLEAVGNGTRFRKKDFDGFLAFFEGLKGNLEGLPIVGIELEKSWVDVREAIEELAGLQATMTSGELWEVCKNNGVVDVQEQLDLSQLFHDLGVFLHFQDEMDDSPSLLSKMVILQNDWATKAVYRVLKSEYLLREKMGRFRVSDLKRVWAKREVDDFDYSPFAGELLELMMKFKLCYRVRDTRTYIAPQLLPVRPPADYVAPRGEKVLQLRYGYDFMPKGIITRLTVELHDLIGREQTLAWRDGFVLEREGSMAEVVESYGKREIQVRAVGDHARLLINRIAYVVNGINRGYNFNARIQSYQFLPCSCVDCLGKPEPHFFKYSELVTYKRKGGRDYPCGKFGNIASIEDVLSLILEGDEGYLDNKRELSAFNALRDLKNGQTVIINNQETFKILASELFSTLKKYDESFFDQHQVAYEGLLRELKDMEIRTLQRELEKGSFDQMKLEEQRELLEAIQAGAKCLGTEIKESIRGLLVAAQDPKLTTTSKLRIITPFIPMFLHYETHVDFSVSASFKSLKDFWGKLFTETESRYLK